MANVDAKGFVEDVKKEAERQLKNAGNIEYIKGFTNGTKMVLDIFERNMKNNANEREVSYGRAVEE